MFWRVHGGSSRASMKASQQAGKHLESIQLEPCPVGACSFWLWLLFHNEQIFHVFPAWQQACTVHRVIRSTVNQVSMQIASLWISTTSPNHNTHPSKTTPKYRMMSKVYLRTKYTYSTYGQSELSLNAMSCFGLMDPLSLHSKSCFDPQHFLHHSQSSFRVVNSRIEFYIQK